MQIGGPRSLLRRGELHTGIPESTTPTFAQRRYERYEQRDKVIEHGFQSSARNSPSHVQDVYEIRWEVEDGDCGGLQSKCFNPQ